MMSTWRDRICISGISPRTAIITLASAVWFLQTLGLAQSVRAPTFDVIYNFGGPEGGFPQAGLTMDRTGNLYGTAFQGGAGGFGGVFELKRTRVGWIEKPLYSFNGGNNGARDGGYPSARVIFGPDGSLYGTTIGGGNSGCNYCGTVFKLKPPTPS